MISNKEARNARLTREAREAAIKLKEYCNLKSWCSSCCFSISLIDGGCLISDNIPSSWHLEAYAPSDMERSFAKRKLNEGFDYVNLDFDMDVRHVTVCDSNKPDIGLILSSDSFGCLFDAGDYSLRSIVDGKVKRRTTKP